MFIQFLTCDLITRSRAFLTKIYLRYVIELAAQSVCTFKPMRELLCMTQLLLLLSYVFQA